MSSNKKNIFLVILIIGVLSMSIAFAALSSRLSISGSVGVSETTWDIRFQNFSSSSTPQTTTLGETNTGVLKSVTTNATKITNLKVDLKKPGDIVIYTFDIKNNGSIDARLSTFTQSMTCEVDNLCGYADYLVECRDSNNKVVALGDTLSKNSSYSCSVTIKYNDSYNTLDDDVNASLTADFQFVQK